MSVRFRPARREDVPAIVALLRDGALGATREGENLSDYFATFDAMQGEGANHLIVGERDGAVSATYQLTFMSGLSLRAARRAQIESVRVAADMRGHGIGAQMMPDAEDRARAAGCRLMQPTTNAARKRRTRFIPASALPRPTLALNANWSE